METPFSMWKTLDEILKNGNDERKLALRDMLRNICMQKNETIPHYLSRFTQCRYVLGGVGENICNTPPPTATQVTGQPG